MIIDEYIDNYLQYKDGKIYWKNREGKHKHLNRKEAGSSHNAGYRRVRLQGIDFLTHRVIFFMHYRYWPEEVDHKNRDRSDNRIENLRPCTISQNRRNSGLRTDATPYGKNIGWNRLLSKYFVRLFKDGKYIYCGSFQDLELAQLVASEAREKYYGEWAYDY